MRILAGLAVILTANFTVPEASPTTYFVRPDGTGDFPTIQAAIDAASLGDTLVLSNGIFRGTNNRDLNLHGKPLLMLSLSLNPDSCGIDCENAVRGITFDAGEDSTSQIRGIAFRNGSSDEGGAVLLVNSSSPSFADCAFTGNTASVRGGAVSCLDNSAPSFASCAFSDNGLPETTNGQGGALYTSSSSPRFFSCLFLRNHCGYSYAYGKGGAFCATEAAPQFVACTFEQNSAGVEWNDSNGMGGAGYFASSSGSLIDCTLDENYAEYGAALGCYNSAPLLTGCTLLRNQASASGALYLVNAPATISRCTLFANYGSDGSGMLSVGAAHATITNTIIAFGNSCGVKCNNGAPALSCCDIYGQPSGDWLNGIEDQLGQNGNISGDPMFCDADGEDFTINARSPCAAGYNPGCGLIGAWPVGCSPRIHVVAADGSGDFPTIQAAIDGARTGDIVELLDGSYVGEGNSDIALDGKALILRSESGDPRSCVIDCGGGQGFTFREHESPAWLEGVCIQGGGGGVASDGGDLTIERCVFRENGGGFSCWGSSARVSGCTFRRIRWSGVECDEESVLRLQNCTFIENSTEGEASVFIRGESSVTLDHCVIAFSSGGPAMLGWGNVTLQCCDLYGNVGGDWIDGIADQVGVDGNISQDPMFCDLYAEDLTLHSASPCAPGGNPDGEEIGAWPVGCITPASPTTYRVEANGSGDCPTIQAGLSVAIAGDTLELGNGRYTGEGNRDLVFWRKAVCVRSESGQPDSCIVDCQSAGRGLSFLFGEDSTTVVQGISFMSGHVLGTGGGGIYCNRSSPRLVGCVFSTNSSDGYGGGGACFNGAAPRFEGCRYVGNYSGYGGALYCNSSSPVVESSLFIANSASSNGGAIFCTGASPIIRQSTLWGNLASTGGGLYLEGTSEPVLEGTIISDCPDGGAIRLLSPSMPTLICCDLFANAGGNWTGPIAGQYGIRGNISEDPWFCNPDAWEFHLAPGSPCLGGSCFQIGALGAGCGELAPQIASVSDIPSDQGGQVRLTWARSFYDGGRDIVISGYAVYRRQDAYLRAAGSQVAQPEDTLATHDRVVRLAGWDCLGMIPARGDPIYQFVAPTLCDSTSQGVCWSVFMVSATTQVPDLYFDSPPDSGYSVDNLAPGVPGNLRFQNPTLLEWNESCDADFDYFAIYGSGHEGLDETAVAIGQTTGTGGVPFLVES